MGRSLWVASLLTIALAVGGCDRLAGSEILPSVPPTPTTSIETVQKSRFSQPSVVTVRGMVGDRVPVLAGTVYELKDATGTIWIVTKNKPPESGAEVTVSGTVRYRSIVLNGKEQGSVYIEQE